ncbi:MAG: dienelactone hydrolase-like enzyme [Acidimicrobiales bacterium]|nr:dienelactone hydrolase-like enzyme [Acidimicrobiales bacterium]
MTAADPEVRLQRIALPSGTAAVLTRPADGDVVARGVVLLPDIGGLRPLFDDLCCRLTAEHGWAVCAPEPWPGREGLTIDQRLQQVGELDDDAFLADVNAAADLLEQEGAERVAVVGFCMGGMFALKAAGWTRFDRIVSFYGMVRLPEHWRSDTVGEPLDVVGTLARDHIEGRILSICGTEDPWVSGEDLDDLAALAAEVARYRGADHGFVHDPDRPAHRAADAADAWARVAALLT